MFTRWNVEEMTGYKPITTFWDDFSIADMFGEAAIRDTYNRAFKEWQTDYKYLTELVMVLNHKIWYWYTRDETISQLYDNLWGQADNWAINNLKGEELSYFLTVTD